MSLRRRYRRWRLRRMSHDRLRLELNRYCDGKRDATDVIQEFFDRAHRTGGIHTLPPGTYRKASA